MHHSASRATGVVYYLYFYYAGTRLYKSPGIAPCNMVQPCCDAYFPCCSCLAGSAVVKATVRCDATHEVCLAHVCGAWHFYNFAAIRFSYSYCQPITTRITTIEYA